ncbi:hypothetical protein MC885_011830 [Smutsia gigantea]|nr:hypothetical protein MC885_011830 [Smutsia gigantea]
MHVCACAYVCVLETCISGCVARAGSRPALSSLSGGPRGVQCVLCSQRSAFRADSRSALTGAGVKWPVTATLPLVNGEWEHPLPPGLPIQPPKPSPGPPEVYLICLRARCPVLPLCYSASFLPCSSGAPHSCQTP